jgi:hypothetical protein
LFFVYRARRGNIDGKFLAGVRLINGFTGIRGDETPRADPFQLLG